MGISIGVSRCSCETPAAPAPDRNPNPSNFQLLDVEQVGRFVIVVLRYPNCTNYEGKKILVFEGVSARAVRSWKKIDPHFCDGGHTSPIARFEPTERGWTRARRLCEVL